MVRSGQGREVVQLSVGNWLTIAGMVAALCTSLVTGAVKVSNSAADLRIEATSLRGEINSLRTELTDVKSRIDRVEKQMDGRVE